jgi:hydroxymethylpyrimidine pyrophosphatase-like HAD family hydrolase
LRYQAMVTDYDETLACKGQVQPSTLDALIRLRDSGRAVVLVTGRELQDLRKVFSRFDLFDLVVSENGTVLYDPETGDEKPLCPPPSAAFVRALQNRAIQPLSVGRCVVATVRSQEKSVFETMAELELKLHSVYNRDALMVLPAGYDKGTGSRTALRGLGIAEENVVAVGDAENDLPLIESAGLPVAVANATPGLKEKAAIVTAGGCGAGIVEIIEHILATDL